VRIVGISAEPPEARVTALDTRPDERDIRAR